MHRASGLSPNLWCMDRSIAVSLPLTQFPFKPEIGVLILHSIINELLISTLFKLIYYLLKILNVANYIQPFIRLNRCLPLKVNKTSIK